MTSAYCNPILIVQMAESIHFNFNKKSPDPISTIDLFNQVKLNHSNYYDRQTKINSP